MTTNHSSTTALGWESDFWKMVEEGGNGANIEFVMKIRDFIHKVREEAKAQGVEKGARKSLKDKLWDFAKSECNGFDLVGIHRCSAGHCGHCGKCDLLSGWLLTRQEENHE